MPATDPPAAGRRRSLRAAALAAAACALAIAIPATAAAKPKVGNGKGGVELRKLGNFDAPVYVDDAPGSSKLLFVVEQGGTIRVLRKNKVLDQPFLDIRERVHFGGEQGLLSVAFPPDYKQSGRFYVYYTTRGGEVNRIAEFRRSSETTANAATERVVMDISHPTFSNHNGGQLQFGPDGHLYIATGDGGGGGDPFEAGQDPNTRLGKLLRIDPTPGNAGAYGVPTSNPFAGPEAGLDEIIATGLRNPWRFSFDSKTGRILIGDVGQNRWEEVDYETASSLSGANFGWDIFEGDHPFDGGAAPAGYQAPIHEYSHDGGGCAITGGYVVRDRKVKSLYGRYLYGDLCTGELRSLVPKLDGARKDRSLGESVPTLSSFGEGAHGRIYTASHEGGVFRLKQK
jgi:glucose/arabinose dehydrogenase